MGGTSNKITACPAVCRCTLHADEDRQSRSTVSPIGPISHEWGESSPAGLDLPGYCFCERFHRPLSVLRCVWYHRIVCNTSTGCFDDLTHISPSCKVTHHSKRVVFQLVEVAILRWLFAAILRCIERLRLLIPAPA